ncbi:hypothetical protein QQ045_003321 [Rhodiola kirilowii]
MKAGEWDLLRVRLGFKNCFSVDRRGLAGGLALLWNEEVEVSVRSYSRWHIDASVRAETCFRLTLFYGNPKVSKREESWQLLRMLKGASDEDWIVMGDFNEILHSDEIAGRRRRGRHQMRKFREALVDCSLPDLGFEGPRFTFSNRRKGVDETKIRLDRVLASEGWMRRNPNTSVLNGWAMHSDHRPIILSIAYKSNKNTSNSEVKFRFEPMWMRDVKFREEVQDIWSRVKSNNSSMGDKLRACGEELNKWNSRKFGRVGKNIRRLKEQISKMQNEGRTEETAKKEAELTNEMDEWLAREELLWRQRARTEWLKEGDRNTTFFKARATNRKNKKLIQKLKKEDGTEVYNNAEILSEVANYFRNLFKASEDINNKIWNDAMEIVPVKVSQEVNKKLKEPYTANEVREALFQMHPTKALGIDGRLISDNILVAHELANVLTHRKPGQDGLLSLKIDMSKAYDRVDWRFLERILLKMGFDETWVRRVLKCVCSVSYKVKVNGDISEQIIPGRGLRQGDPLSPYLFILCQEWLTLKLNAEEACGNLSGVRLARGLQPINHLFFADDCLLFLKADMYCLRKLKQVLETYSKVSGQQVNFQKSEICSSKNIEEVLLYVMGEYMGMAVVEKHSKYLGLPLVVKQNKAEVFRWLEDKVSKKIQDWGALLLSAAGKETLIKSCIQSVPIYTMSCFKLSKTLCEKMTAMTVNFWWNNSTKDRGIHWLRREILQKEKVKGGLGLRNFEALNCALLMKQLWRFLKFPDDLASKIFRAKYFKDGQLFSAKVRPYDSYAWKCLQGVIEMFKTGVICDMVDGRWKWKGTTHGEFTTKSAYSLVRDWMEARSSFGGEVSNIEEVRGAWRNLWRIRVPDRIKILCWRVFHNALPVADNLRRRGCEPEYGCCFCGLKEETVKHLLLECWWTREFWRKLGVEGMNGTQFNETADWLWCYMKENRSTELKKIMVGIWIVWYNRNLQIHGKQGMNLEWCHYRTLSVLQQFEGKKLAGYNDTDSGAMQADQVVIYCDGSWSADSRIGGFAAVAVQNDIILACRAKWLIECSTVREAECLALMEGIALAEGGGWSKVYIASDSSEAIWAVQTGNWDMKSVYEEAKKGMELLANHPEWTFSLIFREDNWRADALAKKARRDLWSWEQMEAIPRGLNCPGVPD